MYVKSKLVSIRLEIVLISVKERCKFAPNVSHSRKSFQAHPMVLLGDVSQVEAHFGMFGGSINLEAR
jgi:hypothetical protein